MVKALGLNFLVPFKHVTLKYDQLIIMAFTNRAAIQLALELSETGHASSQLSETAMSLHLC